MLSVFSIEVFVAVLVGVLTTLYLVRRRTKEKDETVKIDQVAEGEDVMEAATSVVQVLVITIRNKVTFRTQLENLCETSLGTSSDCDLVLSDETCSSLAAKIVAREMVDGGIHLFFYPIMKIYRVVEDVPMRLYYETLFKLDNVCLQVTDLNTDTARDNAWFVKYTSAPDEVDDMGQCYICWNSESGSLIRSPCGNCTGGVHLACLLKWVEQRKNGHCPICRGVLPDEFSAPPPCLELTILNEVIGRRNAALEQNVLRLSLAKEECIYLCAQQDGMVAFDKKSSAQACVTFNRISECFELSGLKQGCTLIVEPNAFEVACGESRMLKIGETKLSVLNVEIS